MDSDARSTYFCLVAPVRKVGAVATREGKWWVVEVDGIGTTQGRTWPEASWMAKDLVTAMSGGRPEDVEITMRRS